MYYRGRGRGMYSAGASSSSQQRYQKSEPSPIMAVHYCKLIEINLCLDKNAGPWFQEFNIKWNLLKNSPPVVTMLINFLENCDNPYEEVLRLVYNAKDFKFAKPKSLAYFIIEEFQKWVQHKPNLDFYLTTSLKISAFNVARKQPLLSFIKIVSNVYKMKTEKEMFLKIIDELIREKQFKEACQIVMVFDIHNSYGIEEFLFPLVLQDKMMVVEEYLSGSKDHQLKLVQRLDSLLGKGSILGRLDEYFGEHDIPEVKHAKLHSKPFRKLVARLKKKYNLSDEVTPNLITRQNEGALSFLIYRRYTENAIGEESFKEMVHEAVKNDFNLQNQLVSLVSYECDYILALTFANFYKVPQENWPHNLISYSRDPQKKLTTQINDEEWEVNHNPNTPEFYKLKIPLDNIHIVDSEEKFERFLATSLNDVHIVGIDCEWKPSFGTQKNTLALIQVATPNKVFIFDVICIGIRANHLWQKFGAMLFNNNAILKLGFGLSGDISMISNSLPSLKVCYKDGFIDLLNVWKEIEKESKIKLPFQSESGPSLGTLVQCCFNFPLNKADQFSNWERRPLRQSQIEYAALDAFCLIEIYHVLGDCCSKAGFNLEDIIDKLLAGSSRTKQKMTKHKSQKRKIAELNIIQPLSPNENIVPAENVKIVCDTMLHGLGKYLRKCGIDTVMLEQNELHSRCVWYYENESRFILTRGMVFNKLFDKVAPGWCLKITSDDLEEQFIQTINYYKIKLGKENIFSRCQICNSNNFVSLTSSTMNALLEPPSQLIKLGPPPADYLEDEATGFSSDDDLGDFDYPQRCDNRKWELCREDKINIVDAKTRLGAVIQINSVPKEIINKIDQFFVCEKCGKVYWDGSHYDRILSYKLKNIIL